MIYLGVDAGYSQTVRSTGVCVIRSADPKPVRAVRVWAHETVAAIETMLDGDSPSAIGIDAPLVPATKGLGFRVVKQYRECEKNLSGGIFQKRCKPGPTNSPRGYTLHKQATKVANVLGLRFDAAPIAEAFPNAFLGMMLPDEVFARPIRRGIKSDVFWDHCFTRPTVMRRLLNRLFADNARRVFGAARAITNHDERAAFVCALTARSAELGAGLICSGQDGGILLPPVDFIQPWARKQLARNGVL